MTTDSPFTDVERQLRDVRSGQEGAVSRAAVEALLESSDPTDKRAGLKAVALCVTGDEDCFDDSLPSLAPHLSAESSDVRYTALQTAISLIPVREDPTADAAAIVNRLDDDSDRVAEQALDAAVCLAEHAPDAAVDAVPEVVDFLGHDRSPVRKAAASFFLRLVETRPDTVEPAVGALVDHLDDTYESPDLWGDAWNTALSDRRTKTDLVSHSHAEAERYRAIREAAARTLGVLARERPDTVRSRSDFLWASVSASDPHVSQSALSVLTVLGETYPTVVVEASEDICACLDAEGPHSDALVAVAVRALGVAVSEDPDRVVEGALDRVDALLESLDHEDPHVRGAAAGVLSHVAEREPDAVSPSTSDVVALLDDDREFVRGNAAWALGVLPSEEAAAALRDRLAAEPDPTVQASIEAALDERGERGE